MAKFFSDDDQADHLDGDQADDLADELEYEPFDDVEWTDPDDLDAIELDVLDDAVPDEESEKGPGDEAGSVEDVPATRAPSPRRRAARSARSRPGSRRAPDSAQDSTPETAPDADSESDTKAAPPSESAAEAAGESADDSVPDAELTSEAESEAATENAPVSEAKADNAADTMAEKTADEPTAEEGAGAAEVVESGEPGAPPEPVIPPEIYCAVLALPPEVGSGVLELRSTGEIEDMPPPGVILTPQFRAPDIEAVKTALADWVRIHLPIQLEITGIKAHVVDAQQYIAAWLLEPQEELQESLHTLKLALAELTLPLGGTTTIGPHVMIGEHVPARRYAHLIGRMQRDFEPQVWQSAELQLVRREPHDQPDNDLDTWEVDQVFD